VGDPILQAALRVLIRTHLREFKRFQPSVQFMREGDVARLTWCG